MTSNTKKILVSAGAFVLVLAILAVQRLLSSGQSYIVNNPVGLSAATTSQEATPSDTYATSSSPSSANWLNLLQSTGISGGNANQMASSSETKNLSQDLFIQYINLQKSGNFSTDTANALVQNIVDKSNQAVAASQYDVSNLKTFSGYTMTDLEAYGNALGTAFIKNAPGKTQNEITILKNSVDKNDPTILNQLDPIITTYRGVADSLMQINAPEEMAETHVELANNFLALAKGVELFKLVNSDAISSLAGVKEYTDAGTLMEQDITTLIKFLNAGGAQFTPSQPGYYFTHLIGV